MYYSMSFRLTHKQTVIITNLLDFIPIVGSIKMVIEGLQGKQFGTRKVLSGVPRSVHTIFGLSFFILDMTSFGTIFSEIGKGILKLGERVALKSAEEIMTRDVLIRVAEEVGIHELVKKQGSVIMEKIEEKTQVDNHIKE